MREMMNIPAHWEVKKLGEVVLLNPKLSKDDKHTDDFEVQFIPMKLVAEESGKIELTQTRKYSEVKKGYTPMGNGDIIFAKVTPCMENGKIACVDNLKNGVGFGSTEFHVLRSGESVLNKYVFYYVVQKKFRREAESNMTGAVGLRRVPKQFIEDYKIPVAPLFEQQQIVSKIEELFSELDKGVEQLEQAQARLKVYRQSVLKAAFEGRLTGAVPQEGLEPSEEGSSPLPTLPEGWRWVKSGELFDFVTSGSRGWAKYYSDQGAIFLRITNLDFDSLNLDLVPDKTQYVNPPSNSEGIRTKVMEGDFLFSITGYLGMFAIAPALDDAYVNQHISLCRPKATVNRRFVGYWIIAKTGGYKYLNKMTKGATKAGLGLDDIKNFPVPIPPTNTEQNKIVSEIERRLSVCDQLEATITQSLQQAATLRQSILKRAFEGRLV